MGEYLSKFDEGSVVASSLTHPSKGDWIIIHSQIVQLAIVEVERLWIRFIQLGCDSDGNLDRRVFSQSFITNDIFCKNAFIALFAGKQKLSFQQFLTAIKWISTATTIEKVKATFGMFNGGKSVNTDLVYRIFKRIYIDSSGEDVRKLTDAFMKQVDAVNQGYVTEEQFVKFAKRLPPTTLDSLLAFNIVPNSITHETQKIFEANRANPSKQQPTVEKLQSVARAVCNHRNFSLLANKLGYSSDDINSFTAKYPADKLSQATAILNDWKSKSYSMATNKELEQALRDAGMSDAVNLLY